MIFASLLRYGATFFENRVCVAGNDFLMNFAFFLRFGEAKAVTFCWSCLDTGLVRTHCMDCADMS